MAAVAKAPRARSWLWLQGLLCGAAISMVPATCLVIAALLAPAVLAMYSESTLKRPVGRAMIMMASAASIEPLRTLWQGGNSLEGAITIISNPSTLALAWLAAASAWVISEGVGLASSEIDTVRSRRKAVQLAAEREALELEWGKSV